MLVGSVLFDANPALPLRSHRVGTHSIVPRSDLELRELDEVTIFDGESPSRMFSPVAPGVAVRWTWVTIHPYEEDRWRNALTNHDGGPGVAAEPEVKNLGRRASGGLRQEEDGWVIVLRMRTTLDDHRRNLRGWRVVLEIGRASCR